MRIQFTFYSDSFEWKPVFELRYFNSQQRKYWGHGNIYEIHWLWFHLEFCKLK